MSPLIIMLVLFLLVAAGVAFTVWEAIGAITRGLGI